jgi:excisionase family DNA binding protein
MEQTRGETMSAKKEFANDWFNNVAEYKPRKKLVDVESVEKLEQLPRLVSAKEAAEQLSMSSKTINDWMTKGHIKSLKVRGRRFTTVKWLAEFLQNECSR